MKIDDYRLLLKLNEVGTIRGTAKELHISQPAITQRLKYIEDYFSLQLFIRTPKTLVLTPVGEQIIAHAREVVKNEQHLKNTLYKDGEVAGTISIGASSVISQYFLPKILEKYTKAFPNVTIDLVTGTSDDIKRPEHEFHVRLIRGEKMKQGMCKHLFSDPLFVYDTKPFPTDHMKERTLIEFKSDPDFHLIVNEWFLQNKWIKPNKTFRVDQIETCKQFMKHGLGMAVLPKSVTTPEMVNFPHIELTYHDQPVVRENWVCYQEELRELPQVDQFLQLLENFSFESN